METEQILPSYASIPLVQLFFWDHFMLLLFSFFTYWIWINYILFTHSPAPCRLPVQKINTRAWQIIKTWLRFLDLFPRDADKMDVQSLERWELEWRDCLGLHARGLKPYKWWQELELFFAHLSVNINQTTHSGCPQTTHPGCPQTTHSGCPQIAHLSYP